MSWGLLKHVRAALQSAIAGACLVAVALGGCGGEDAPAQKVRLDAARDGSLRFERGAVSARPGRVRVEMANPADIPHAIGIRGNGVDEDGETVGKGDTSSADATVRPGRYTLFCPVAGHEEAGMLATLTVK